MVGGEPLGPGAPRGATGGAVEASDEQPRRPAFASARVAMPANIRSRGACFPAPATPVLLRPRGAPTPRSKNYKAFRDDPGPHAADVALLLRPNQGCVTRRR